MKIRLLLIGKTEEEYLRAGIRVYETRIRHYVPFEIVEIPAVKNTAKLSPEAQNAAEAELIRKRTAPGDIVVLLDERGREMSSAEFASFLGRQFLSGGKTLVFVVGGAFGLDPSLKKGSSEILSLSRMTFSHQMVRLFFTEQLYRGLTILKGESYHHE